MCERSELDRDTLTAPHPALLAGSHYIHTAHTALKGTVTTFITGAALKGTVTTVVVSQLYPVFVSVARELREKPKDGHKP